MPNRIVLVPFPKAASAKFLFATRGGNYCPEMEITLRKFKADYEDALKLYSEQGLSTGPSVLKKSQYSLSVKPE